MRHGRLDMTSHFQVTKPKAFNQCGAAFDEHSNCHDIAIVIGASLRKLVRSSRSKEPRKAPPLRWRRWHSVLDFFLTPRRSVLRAGPAAELHQAPPSDCDETRKRDAQKYALACLRIAADCRSLAADVASPGLKAHFLKMADAWENMACDSDTALARMDAAQSSELDVNWTILEAATNAATPCKSRVKDDALSGSSASLGA